MSNPVIDQIRRSSGRPAHSPIAPRPAIGQPRVPGPLHMESTRFFDELQKLAGLGRTLSQTEIDGALQALVAEQNIRKATVWDSPRLAQLGIAKTFQALGVELVSPNASKHEMALCDLGVTEAEYMLPETGTLVLTSSAQKPRAVSLLPPIHLAIVRPDMLRADMHQVFEEAKENQYLVFITGPSRTADIELTVTLGVHGPRHLFVWMVAE